MVLPEWCQALVHQGQGQAAFADQAHQAAGRVCAPAEPEDKDAVSLGIMPGQPVIALAQVAAQSIAEQAAPQAGETVGADTGIVKEALAAPVFGVVCRAGAQAEHVGAVLRVVPCAVE